MSTPIAKAISSVTEKSANNGGSLADAMATMNSNSSSSNSRTVRSRSTTTQNSQTQNSNNEEENKTNETDEETAKKSGKKTDPNDAQKFSSASKLKDSKLVNKLVTDQAKLSPFASSTPGIANTVSKAGVGTAAAGAKSPSPTAATGAGSAAATPFSPGAMGGGISGGGGSAGGSGAGFGGASGAGSRGGGGFGGIGGGPAFHNPLQRGDQGEYFDPFNRGGGGGSGYNSGWGAGDAGDSNIFNGKFGAKVHTQPGDSPASEKAWRSFSILAGHAMSGSELNDRVKAIFSASSSEQVRTAAGFLAANNITSAKDIEKLTPFLEKEMSVLKNMKTHSGGSGDDFKQAVWNENKRVFNELARSDGEDPSELRKYSARYGVSQGETPYMYGGTNVSAAKDARMLGSEDETYKMLKGLYANGHLASSVNVSFHYMLSNSNQSDQVAFANSTEGLVDRMQSELKRNGVAGPNGGINLVLVAQGDERNLMEFDGRGNLIKNGSERNAMGDFLAWKEGTLMKAAERLAVDIRAEKGDAAADAYLGHLKEYGFQVSGATLNVHGHGAPEGTAMMPGTWGDHNIFGANDATKVADAFNEMGVKNAYCRLSTCFGGMRTAPALFERLSNSVPGMVAASGPYREGVVPVDSNRRNHGAYETFFATADGVLGVCIDRSVNLSVSVRNEDLYRKAGDGFIKREEERLNKRDAMVRQIMEGKPADPKAADDSKPKGDKAREGDRADLRTTSPSDTALASATNPLELWEKTTSAVAASKEKVAAERKVSEADYLVFNSKVRNPLNDVWQAAVEHVTMGGKPVSSGGNQLADSRPSSDNNNSSNSDSSSDSEAIAKKDADPAPNPEASSDTKNDDQLASNTPADDNQDEPKEDEAKKEPEMAST